MEIVSIEARTFEAMMSRFEAFTQRVDTLYERNKGNKMHEWLDNQQVCQILNVSKRTLQAMRDSSKISYSKIGYKIFYRPADVEKLIETIAAK